MAMSTGKEERVKVCVKGEEVSECACHLGPAPTGWAVEEYPLPEPARKRRESESSQLVVL